MDVDFNFVYYNPKALDNAFYEDIMSSDSATASPQSQDENDALTKMMMEEYIVRTRIKSLRRHVSISFANRSTLLSRLFWSWLRFRCRRPQ